jgi:aspartate/methionine/tyrosine aminotransferase
VRDAFLPKRELMLRRARELGLGIDREPDGTFYAFVSVRDLPAPIADGMAFFRAALEYQVICVPGLFFDVNPGHRRARRLSRFHQYVRLSFGPNREEVVRGLDRLEAMIRGYQG